MAVEALDLKVYRVIAVTLSLCISILIRCDREKSVNRLRFTTPAALGLWGPIVPGVTVIGKLESAHFYGNLFRDLFEEEGKSMCKRISVLGNTSLSTYVQYFS